MSNVQAVYLIIVDPHPQEDIRAFSVVVLTSEPGSGAHYCSIPKGPSTLTEYNPSCGCSVNLAYGTEPLYLQMVLWFQWSSLDHTYLRLSHSETVVVSLKLA